MDHNARTCPCLCTNSQSPVVHSVARIRDTPWQPSRWSNPLETPQDIAWTIGFWQDPLWCRHNNNKTKSCDTHL